MRYSRINNIMGWVVFLIAFVVYYNTFERNISFWDCAEYISSCVKLAIPHAPGAIFFQIMGSIWTIFAFNNSSKYAYITNLSSALYSSITIMFLFWTITFFCKKKNLFIKDKNYISKYFNIIFSGFIGSIIFLFSDTFWFSAVEGEVYAMASMFTSILIFISTKLFFKKKYYQGILLCSLIIGISTGVHFMVLLTIPTIIYSIIIDKNSSIIKNIIINVGISVSVFIIIYFWFFSSILKFFSFLELYLVNRAHMPFNSGLYIGLLIFLIIFIFLILIFRNKIIKFILWNIVYLLIGFSCWVVIPIRASSNPSININDPSNPISLLEYFNREQYGHIPILYGPVYTAHITNDGIIKDSNGNLLRKKIGEYYCKDFKKKRYIKCSNKYKYIYNDKYIKFFPKMFEGNRWDVMENYANYYGFPKFRLKKEYINNEDFCNIYHSLIDKKNNNNLSILDLKKYSNILDIEPPSFLQELYYFIDYQVTYMFIRYFMWNFSGRQNDLEGNFEVTKGNWLTGIKFLDNLRLGNQTNVPVEYKNYTTNCYYMLPFILGLIGFIYNLKNDRNYAISLILLFIITGLGVVFYTSVKPFEVRERDYSLVSSFYTYSIWCGIGVYYIFKLSDKISFINNYFKKISISIIILFIPLLMAFNNWDDHDRSSRNAAYSVAHDNLSSLDKNSIIFVYGDNDTYPLWGLQETIGFRDDVRVANYTLASSDWYIRQLLRKVNNSSAISSYLNENYFRSGVNDQIILANDYIKEVFKNFDDLIDSSKTKKKFYDIYDLSFNDAKKYLCNSNIDYEKTVSFYKSILVLYKYVNNDTMSIREALDFIKHRNSNESRALDLIYGNNNDMTINYLPVNNIVLPVDKNNVIKYKILDKKFNKNILNYINIKINDSILYKNDLFFLSLLGNYKWDRPIYFSGKSVFDKKNTLYLSDNLLYNGLNYKLVPINNPLNDISNNIIDVNKLYNIYSKYVIPDYTKNYSSLERSYISLYRDIAYRLSNSLLKNNNYYLSNKILNHIMSKIPLNKIYDSESYELANIANLYSITNNKMSEDLFSYLFKIEDNKISYFYTLDNKINTIYKDFINTNNYINYILFLNIKSLMNIGKKNEAIKLFNSRYDIVINRIKNLNDKILNKNIFLEIEFLNIKEMLSMCNIIDKKLFDISVYKTREVILF